MPTVRAKGSPGFQSSTRQTDFATITKFLHEGFASWFQSSTRQTDFATVAAAFNDIDVLVSILYEADRLCNKSSSWRSSRAFRFQSSTRQTDFATLEVCQECDVGFQVSILYEADRLCNRSRETLTSTGIGSFNPLRGRQTLQPIREFFSLPGGSLGFQSSTRQTDFATESGLAFRMTLTYQFQSSTRQTDFATAARRSARTSSHGVSILYEADRLCNGPPWPWPTPGTAVSILYEADRLCNKYGGGIADLRGSMFQSSTRQTDFATR